MNTNITNLGYIFDVEQYRYRVAFIGLDNQLNEKKYTYGELNTLADKVAYALSARQYPQGARIALLAENSVSYIAVVLGIMRAGLVAVPLNYRWSDEQIKTALDDSGAVLVFCDTPREKHIPNYLPWLSLSFSDNLGLNHDIHNEAFQSPSISSDEPAFMLYTSGSTGKPKGVILSHAAHIWVVKTRLHDAALTDECALIAAPLYHMNALALSFLVLASGATAVLLPKFHAPNYIKAIERYECTWLTAVPPMIAMMLREHELIKDTDLHSVRAIRMGSAPVSASLLEQIRTWMPNAKIINAYGTTESSPIAFGPHPDHISAPPLAIGYAHKDVQIRLRDQHGMETDEGVLEIKSPGLMTGYHNRPDIHPFTPDGFYVTGDVFHRDQHGFYTFVGRKDDMFVCGGENIYPSAVEKLLEKHPAIQQACVIAIDDDIKGQKPVAFVVLKHDQIVTEQALKDFCLQHAAAYQHPRHIWFLEALPLAATNKIDRHALKKEVQERLYSHR